jgi:hypothetical protein
VPDPVVPELVVPEVPDVPEPLIELSTVPVTSTLWPTCCFSSASCPSSVYVEPLLIEPLLVPDVVPLVALDVLVPDVPVLLVPDVPPEPIIALVSM